MSSANIVHASVLPAHVVSVHVEHDMIFLTYGVAENLGLTEHLGLIEAGQELQAPDLPVRSGIDDINERGGAVARLNAVYPEYELVASGDDDCVQISRFRIIVSVVTGARYLMDTVYIYEVAERKAKGVQAWVTFDRRVQFIGIDYLDG